MAHHQIVALLVIIAGVVIVGLIAYFNGCHEGERRGNVKAAIFADKLLALEAELEREQNACEQLELTAEQHRAQLQRLAVDAGTAADQLAESERRRRELDDENERLQASLAAERGQVDDMEQALNCQAEQLADFSRDNASAAAALEETAALLNIAEARSLRVADLPQLQHAARQLGQQAAQFRRTGSQKTNHADLAATYLLDLIARLQPIQQQSEEPSPRQAA
ncbi:hypothetical protein ACIPK7_06415 [Pseudomonas sp. NPDC086581]|uniref:hypothetical protein n=1 Tax=Pseudomonas sp. NPDC086581 TaxID=3364432 RepID=UPI003827CACB